MLRRLLIPCVAPWLAVSAALAQVPAPASRFGFEVGADRKLADWQQLTSYYEAVAQASPRVTVDTLGQTTAGRPFIMLTITSPENHARLTELREIQLKLADPRKLSGPDELARLLERGRTVVLITHGIHATEVGGSQMAARLVYTLASSDDPKVREILDNVILLDIPCLNPDGLQWVVEWYRRWVGTPYEAVPLPKLYHYYVGHDNNRDWYAFTQVETQLTVSRAHNAWHPQIVHDIHQMGSTGARLFAPPYIDPVEPNVDPLLVSALNQLGAYMAAELMAQGKRGVVINAIYDAWTPARAYQHYHGGVRILTETASARIASPITLTRDQVRGGRAYDASQRSWKFPAPWEGGEWRLGDIVEYQYAGAMALLTNAARNRRFWLENFYAVNKRAVERWPSWPQAWVLPAGQANREGLEAVLRILRLGDVEVRRAEQAFTAAGREFAAGSYVVPMNQPYASFAQTLLERQDYPDLREYPGGPPKRPYDVTAHTLPLLMNVEAVPVPEALSVPLSGVIPLPAWANVTPPGLAGRRAPRIALYKSWVEPMSEGWTRWLFDTHGIAYDTVHDADIRAADLSRRYDVLIFESQPAREIVDGFSPQVMPEPYAGGLGPAGVAAVRQFVEAGGRLIAVEQAADFAIEALGLQVRNAVADLPPRDFYIPGSILRVELDAAHPIAAGMPAQTIGWFWGSSRVFEVSDPRVRVVARYGAGNPLLSGWILGPEHVADKPAIVEASVGRGSVVLFGFTPNYRGQSIATWPLLFNAMSTRRRGR